MPDIFLAQNSTRAPRLATIANIVAWLLLVTAAVAALIFGLHLRQWAWDQSTPWRFQADIRNAYVKGQMVNDQPEGYLNLYSRFRDSPRAGTAFNLDYPPLRLLIISRWVAWTRTAFPAARDWQASYAFNAPLLAINTACGIAGAVGMWILITLFKVRRVAARFSDGHIHLNFRPTTPAQRLKAASIGLAAAMLFWFNPALIWDAHVWPQWDIWPLPFFIFAMLAASLDAWWIAGALLALGAMLKGQTLLVAPVFLLCPLFAGKPAAACRCAVGFLLIFLACAAPWLLRSPSSENWRLSPFCAPWLASILLAALLAHPAIRLFQRYPLRRAIVAIICVGLLAWPFILHHDFVDSIILCALLALFAAVFLLPSRWAPRLWFWLTAAAVIALAICPRFGGNMDWWTVGFQRGTTQYMRLHIGSTLNLGSILERFHWTSPTNGVFTLGHETYTLRTVLIAIYCLGLILCALAASQALRRADARALVALCTPWILMYAILPQMHDRYLVFAAGLTAVAAGVSLGLTFIHLLITALAWASILASNAGGHPPWLRNTLHSIYPDASWLTLLCAAIFLWTAIARKPSNQRAFN